MGEVDDDFLTESVFRVGIYTSDISLDALTSVRLGFSKNCADFLVGIQSSVRGLPRHPQ